MERCLIEYASDSPEATEALGERLAGELKPVSVIALKGGLGAGKTCLVKGIARALGISENITSPTYTIVNEYSASLGGQTVPFRHIDAYRLNGDEDFDSTGAGELIGRGIAIIEWSDRIPCSIPADAISIEIEITGPDSRVIKMRNKE